MRRSSTTEYYSFVRILNHFHSPPLTNDLCFISFSLSDYAFGDGWYPAIMSSQNEVGFVRQGQRGFINRTSYYIGGSTNSAPFATIGLSAY